jgi:hypothetical protein
MHLQGVQSPSLLVKQLNWKNSSHFKESTNVQFDFRFDSDPAVQALQFLDVISMKDPSQKAQFFRTTLTDIFPYIPRVR